MTSLITTIALALTVLVLSLLALRVVQNVAPHQVRLILGSEVEIIMTCREPLLTGDGVCLPEGHTYRGVYEAWVE